MSSCSSDYWSDDIYSIYSIAHNLLTSKYKKVAHILSQVIELMAQCVCHVEYYL